MTARLRAQHRVGRMVVVAHSMGGLVSRQSILEDFEANATRSVALYVTISSPLGGMSSAATGVRRSPVVVHSWRGLAPGSEFLDGLYYGDVPQRAQRRRLPAHTSYHMLFGYRGDSGDGVVSIASQLREEAQEEARSLRGFDEDHTSILRSPDAIAHLNELLATL
jgi:pimeloyl-ACP methyl ester carboxylesterase